MTITINKRALYLAAFFSFILSVTAFLPAFAETSEMKLPLNPSAQFVQQLGDVALSTLTGNNVTPAMREQRVRQLLEAKFDIQAIGRFAMGPYWREASDTQRREYMTLFENMIVKVYAKRFADYSGQILKVTGSIPVDENNSIISSQVLQKDGPAITLEWRVRNKDNAFKIMDVIVEGVSMSVTQRADFSAVIQHGGGNIDVFLSSLRSQNKTALALN